MKKINEKGSKQFKKEKIEKFYTDSYSDYPLIDFSALSLFFKNGVGIGEKINIREKEDLCK